MYLGTYIAMSLRGNVHVWMGCTKTRSTEISMVLHWQPPNVHIFGTDRSNINKIMGYKVIMSSALGFVSNTKCCDGILLKGLDTKIPVKFTLP